MKHLSSLILLITFFAGKSVAQTSIWSVDAANYVGKTVSFDEYADDVSYNPAAQTVLIKLADPDVKNSPVITIVFYHVINKKRVNWLKSLNGETISVTGKLLYNRGKFTIAGNDVHTRIKAEADLPMNDPVPEAPPVSYGKNIDIKDAAKHVGELINLCDTVHAYPATADSLTLFCMGGRYPNQLLTVAVKNRDDIFNVDHDIGDPMCVTGTIALINGKPVLLIKGPVSMLFFSYPKER
jgi:hypothetical protein